jgi:hypothetical protein
MVNWARHFPIDGYGRVGLGGFALDLGESDGESAEKEIADVREDGGAAGGNPVFGKELVEGGEGSWCASGEDWVG